MQVLQTHDLTKYYGRVRGVEAVNFSIREGEVFGFIGPNGAGKSTLIRLLLSLIYPTSGSATIFGHDVVREAKAVNRYIGYLPSEVNYYDQMTARELLEYSTAFYGIKVPQRMQELAQRFGLRLDRNVKDLSMGNKKKVALLQALLHQPRLLILDEPTNGLDPLMQAKLFEVLQEERERGTTIFFSSHILSDVQRLCDRVAIIRNGEIVATEAMQQLRQKRLRKCRLVLANGQEQLPLELPGMDDLRQEGRAVYFNYEGDMKALVSSLQPLPLEDVVIEEPTLEEVFMHFYQEEESQ